MNPAIQHRAAKPNLPPHMSAGDRLILVDGVCKLCNAWSRFIIRHDRQRLFQLASVQSPEGRRILKHFGMPTTYFDTVLYVEGNRAYRKSDAFLRIVAQLGWPWKLLFALRLCPRRLRDGCYDLIARNRYRLFGLYSRCSLPDSDHEQRFLDTGIPPKLPADKPR